MALLLGQKKSWKKYLQELEDAKLHDHRKIGKDLGLFVFPI